MKQIILSKEVQLDRVDFWLIFPFSIFPKLHLEEKTEVMPFVKLLSYISYLFDLTVQFWLSYETDLD